jgi:hypothetical protein
MKQMLHREWTAKVKTTTAMSFLHVSGQSKLSFLVDSGASLSIFLRRSWVQNILEHTALTSQPFGVSKPNLGFWKQTNNSRMIFSLPIRKLKKASKLQEELTHGPNIYKDTKP